LKIRILNRVTYFENNGTQQSKSKSRPLYSSKKKIHWYWVWKKDERSGDGRGGGIVGGG
jgi:hypothetical protein